MSSMSMSSGKGKGKGKVKVPASAAAAAAAAAALSPSNQPTNQVAGVNPEIMPIIVPCAPYLPTLQHVSDDTIARSHRLAIHTLTTALRAQDPSTFARIAHHGNLLEFIETYLRFRPPYPSSSTSLATDRALDVLTFAWFRRLAAYVATPAAMAGTPGEMVNEMILDHVSALMMLDFCKWYGHCMPAAVRILADLVQARPMLVAEIEDVVRVCSHLMGKQVTAHVGGSSPMHLEPSPGGAGGDGLANPLVVADALGTFKSLIRVLPSTVSASAFDDAFLLTLAGFYEAVLVPNGDARTLSLTTHLAMDVIVCRFLADPSSESIGHLATLLHMMMDLAHAHHGADKQVDGSLIAAIVADTPLVDDLKCLDEAKFHGDTSVVSQLDSLRAQVLEYRQAQQPSPSSTPAAIADTTALAADDPDTAVAITQVLDLFPDMSAGTIRHLLLQYSNDTAKLINALLMDESLRSFQPSAPTAPQPEITQPIVDEALLASVRERFAHVEEFAAAKQVSGRSMIKESKSDAKRKVLALAARIAAEDEEEAQWDDEYDDTYDSVDVRVADGTAEEEVETSAGAKKTPSATANIKRSNVGSEAMVNDPAAMFEADLFQAWSANPAVFERSGKRLPERARLRERTGMSDQQIEGWASMLRRTPARVRHLQNKFQFAGNRAKPRSSTAVALEKGEDDGDQQQLVQSTSRRDSHKFPLTRGGNTGGGGNPGRGRGRGGSDGHASARAGAGGTGEGEHDSAQSGRSRGGSGHGGRGGKDVRAERVKAHWKKTRDMA